MLKVTCMFTQQILYIPIAVVWGIRKRNAEISTVSASGTFLKNNEYIRSKRERILEMKVRFLMTLNKPTFLVQAGIKINISWINLMVQIPNSQIRFPGFESWPYHLLAVWCLASYLTFLCFSFPFIKWG